MKGRRDGNGKKGRAVCPLALWSQLFFFSNRSPRSLQAIHCAMNIVIKLPEVPLKRRLKSSLVYWFCLSTYFFRFKITFGNRRLKILVRKAVCKENTGIMLQMLARN